MSVTSMQEAANKAEQSARVLTAAIVKKAAAASDDELVQVNAQLAQQLLSNAEQRAKMTSREVAEDRIDLVRSSIAEIDQQFDDGLLSTYDAIERLDRIKSLQIELWIWLQRRRVWEAASEEVRSILLGEAPNGAQ